MAEVWVRIHYSMQFVHPFTLIPPLTTNIGAITRIWYKLCGTLFSGIKDQLKSSFLKYIKCHSKKWPCYANTKFDHYILEKSFLHMNKCIYMCTYLRRALFRSMISEHGIAIATSIFGLAYDTFWKRAFQMLNNILIIQRLNNHTE